MGFAVFFFTVVWAGVGIVLPVMTPKGPHRELIQCILIITAATCWLFWLCCYMAQMNPMIGPKLHQNTILMMAREWSFAEFEGYKST